jgi:CheY-like chemotaxis protein
MQTKTALVVDDSRVARLTLSKLLQSQGFDIVEHGSGEDALQWLQQAAPAPDIIFMDVMMPGIDGLTATREIKAAPALSAIPVVVCTGKDTEADLQQALASGAAAVLSKPPAADALSQLLSGITVAEADTATPEAEAAPTSSMPSPDQLLQELRGQLWPELEQKLAALIAPLEQQLEQQQTTQADSGADALTEVSQQLSDNVQQQFAELKQGFESKASDLLSMTAEQAVATAVSRLGLDDKLNALLNSEGKNWLQQQEAALKNTIELELKPELAASLGPELEAAVSQQVLVQLNEQVQRRQEEMMTQQQAALASVKGQLAMQRNLTFGAGLVAIVALVLALI